MSTPSEKNTSWNQHYNVKLSSLPEVQELFERLIAGDRNALARGITLLESENPDHAEKQTALIEACLPYTGKSKRIGITGIPGAGKSTFIEALGMQLCNQGTLVAVLAIDPTSSKSGGSILGDKTRMAGLASHANAFIRPSPSGETLGGIASRTREAMLLCEAAGFEVVMIETVGVGQSETLVRSLTDLFLLLVIPNAGDELQGIKRGIMEMADMILVNKADGDALGQANLAAQQIRNAVHLYPMAASNCETYIGKVSALEGSGIAESWDKASHFFNQVITSGWLVQQRLNQEVEWFQRIMQNRWLSLITKYLGPGQIEDAASRIRAGNGNAYTEATSIVREVTKLLGKDKI